MMNLFQSNQLEFAWWVEINTNIPRCIYYFGPFDSEKEAQLYKSGYVEDLYQEEARDIVALVKQCQPDVLTIFQEKLEVLPSMCD
ncbi:MAG: DUF1816 domain-containing protein [Nostoc sp.]|uniref:DUF1816 domain-containing protein n=1 Tax=Nostoc sp. TaxID=1180 RepID=UPI002FF8758D